MTYKITINWYGEIRGPLYTHATSPATAKRNIAHRLASKLLYNPRYILARMEDTCQTEVEEVKE